MVGDKVVKSESYSIYHYNSNLNSSIVFICFDEMEGGLNSKGFGVEFLIKNNIEVLFVSHKRLSFYQELSDIELYEHVKKHLVKKKVFTYGTSLGGYAALYYAPILKAQAIAFSPRCSADPIYINSAKFNIDFKHESFVDQKVKNTIKPIVIIDENEFKDYEYFTKKILPAYKEDICKVDMKFATHHIPKVMLEVGILKDFVLHIIENNKPPEFNFEFMQSGYSLSHQSLKSVLRKDFKEANLLLKQILNLMEGGNSKLLLYKSTRLQAYNALVVNRSLNHKLDKIYIRASERSHVIKQHINLVENNSNPQVFLESQVNMYMNLLDYERALEISTILSRRHPSNPRYKKMQQRIRRSINFSREWII